MNDVKKEKEIQQSDLNIGTIYECLVIDNTCFWENGRIRVRLCTDSNTGGVVSDLSINPSQSLKDGISNYGESEDENFKGDGITIMDTYAELSTCFGGSFDHGVFTLPQPNTHGLVSKMYSEGLNKPRWVWLGALVRINPTLNAELHPVDKADMIQDISIPSDSIDMKNGFNSGEDNFSYPKNKNHAIIMKQKETYWSKDEDGKNSDNINDDSSKTLSFQEAKTLNMAVVDKNRTFIIHEMYDDDNNYIGRASITIDNDVGISVKFAKNGDDKYESSMEILNDGTAKLESNYNDKVVNKFSADTEKLEINHKDEKLEGGIYIGDTTSGESTEKTMKISVRADGAEESIVMKKNKIDINVDGGSVAISAKDIALGSGDGYVLTSKTPGTISNFENVSFTALKGVRA